LSFVEELLASSISMRFINFTNPTQHTPRTEKRQQEITQTGSAEQDGQKLDAKILFYP
jgi:hypothetical protein